MFFEFDFIWQSPKPHIFCSLMHVVLLVSLAPLKSFYSQGHDFILKKKTRGTEAKPGGICWCTSVVMVPALRVYRLLVKLFLAEKYTFSFARKIFVDDIVRRRICRRLRLGNNLSTTENKIEEERRKWEQACSARPMTRHRSAHPFIHP